jgi:antitoxin ParD1/3/4
LGSVEKISIALPPEMVSSIRQAVESGEYSSSSEVVRDALRDWSRKRALHAMGLDELRKVWQEAVVDGSPGVSPHDVIERLERKYQALADASGEREECA